MTSFSTNKSALSHTPLARTLATAPTPQVAGGLPRQHPVLRVALVTRCDRLSETVLHIFTRTNDAVSVMTTSRPSDTDDAFDVVCLDRRAVATLDRHLRLWRRRLRTAQLLVLHLDTVDDLRSALDAGSDDAVFADDPTLESRLHAAARRARGVRSGRRVAIGDVLYDPDGQRLWCAGEEVGLSRRESAVFDCLIRHGPGPVSSATLNVHVWEGEASRGVIDVYIGYVRRKLLLSRNVVMRTHRGRGYQLVVQPGRDPAAG